MLAIHGRRLAIRVGQIVEAVQNLNLKHAGKEHAAVAPILAVALDLRGSCELDMELNVGILGSRSDNALAGL